MTNAVLLKEVREGETRVAATPETLSKFAKAGLRFVVQANAGAAAGFDDEAYRAVGAEVEAAPDVARADLVLKVAAPTLDEVAGLKRGATLVSMVQSSLHPDETRALAEAGVTSLALELIPRITRGQSMDVLSSQATVAGYKAVLLGATELARLCPLLMTAAGTIAPAKVVVFGAGVAGLMAIATARRLGCVVEATDVRMAAKEQVESLGARFIDVPGSEDMEDAGGYAKEQGEDFLRRQREEVAKRVAEAHLVITTALIPGRKAPLLVPRAMVESMGRGSVIVDMAVEAGGNCELSQLGQTVEHQGVKIVGVPNLPATVPMHASELFSKNVLNLLKPFVKEGQLNLDFTDEVLLGCRLTHAGSVWHAPTCEALGLPVPAVEPAHEPDAPSDPAKKGQASA